jgi:hypothetical protein
MQQQRQQERQQLPSLQGSQQEHGLGMAWPLLMQQQPLLLLLLLLLLAAVEASLLLGLMLLLLLLVARETGLRLAVVLSRLLLQLLLLSAAAEAMLQLGLVPLQGLLLLLLLLLLWAAAEAVQQLQQHLQDYLGGLLPRAALVAPSARRRGSAHSRVLGGAWVELGVSRRARRARL